MSVAVRLVREDDAADLTALLRANRAFLAPWEPVHEDDYFTEEHQRRLLGEALTRHRAGATLPCAIVVDGILAGRINVNNIVRGAFQSAHLGYWVGQAYNGRGVATAATAATVRWAFGELGLHRLQADTLLDNTPSQRVLLRNGFTRIGTAQRYLRIAGHWQDCHLYQLLNEPEADGN